jgi:hypothetical protein
MNLNVRPAPLQVVLAVKRRLEKSNPGARLDERAVKLVAIPGVPYDATVFCFEQASKVVLVAEFCRPDLPHIYNAAAVEPGAGRMNALAMLKLLVGLSATIASDRRFQRSIITLNGHDAHRLAGKVRTK